MRSLSFLVSAFGNAASACDTIKSIRAQTAPGVSCVVLADSPDAVLEACLAEAGPEVTLRIVTGDPAEALRAALRGSEAALAVVASDGVAYDSGAAAAVLAAWDGAARTIVAGDLALRQSDGTLAPHSRAAYDPAALLGQAALLPATLFAAPAVLLQLGLHQAAPQHAAGCRITATALRDGLNCVIPDGPIATLPQEAMMPADGPDAPDVIADTFAELALTAADCALLRAACAGQPDTAALSALLRRHRSARLAVALSRALRAAGSADDVLHAVTGPVDWTPLPAQFVRVASNHAPRPLFTILIATFNAAADLPETLRSIAEQNRDDVECIVIDGGSRDDTLDVARAWPQVVTQCFSQPDRGLYDALSKGLGMARGVLIGIVGAGDCYLPGALDSVAAAHLANRTDVYGGQTIEITPEGHTRRRKDEPWGLNAFVSGGPVGHNGMFATRDAYDEIGPFGQVYPMAEDTRWMHRAIRAGKTFTYLPQAVVLFPLTGMSNKNPDLVWQEAHGLIKQNFPLIDLNREDALKLLFGARGWCAPEEIKPVIARHAHLPLNISAALALRAENVDTARMLDIFDGVLWHEAAPLYARNGMRFVGKTPEARPFLSIVLPSYNVGDYLGKALRSILMQDEEDIEVIVVNDGATDHTLAVAQAFAAVDGRVRILTQHNQGLGQARLSGLPLCRGDYVWFIDSDDFLRDDALARIVAVLRDTTPDAYMVNFAYIDEAGKTEFVPLADPGLGGLVSRPVEREKVYCTLAGWNAQTWRFIVRREMMAVHDLTFPVGYYYEDHHFALKLMARCETVFVDAAVSYMYLRRSGSISTVRSRRAFDFLHIRRLCLDFLKSEGLLDRMQGLALSYVMPAGFARHHVAPEMLGEFVQALVADMDAEERAILLRCGGSADFALLAEAAPDWVASLSQSQHEAQFLPLVQAAAHRTYAAATPRAAPHPLSRTLLGHQISGLYGIEQGVGNPALPAVYAWSEGREIFLRLRPAGQSRPTLHVRFRNIIPGQILLVEAPGLVQACPAVSHDIAQQQSFFVALDSAKEDLVVRISASHTNHFDTRVGAVIIESIDLLNGDVGAWLPPMQPAQVPVVSAPADSRVQGLHVDVRLRPENRSYVHVGHDCDISGTFVFERGVGSITLGDGVSIGNGSLLICTQPEGIHIGRNVMLSWNVTVLDNNSHSLDRALRENDSTDWLAGLRKGKLGIFKNWHGVASAPVVIGDGAWVGFGSVIMKGVTIGEGAVVASRSVVTRDVPPYSVVGGNPARLLSQDDTVMARRAIREADRFPDVPLPPVTFGPAPE